MKEGKRAAADVFVELNKHLEAQETEANKMKTALESLLHSLETEENVIMAAITAAKGKKQPVEVQREIDGKQRVFERVLKELSSDQIEGELEQNNVSDEHQTD